MNKKYQHPHKKTKEISSQEYKLIKMATGLKQAFIQERKARIEAEQAQAQERKARIEAEQAQAQEHKAHLETKRTLTQTHMQCKQLKELSQTQQQTIQQEREEKAELLSEKYWNDEMYANPEITEIDKSVLYALMQYFLSVKKVDGYFYYSCGKVAELLGNRSKGKQSKGNAYQAVKRVVRKLREHGYIQSDERPQKFNKTRKNTFFKFSDELLSYPRSLTLGDHSDCGGDRIAIHSGCGGTCKQEMVYTCSKCGECHINAKNVYHVTDEEYENRKRFEDSLPTMQEIEDQYACIEACDIRDDVADEMSTQEVLSMETRERVKDRNTPQREGLEEGEWEEIQDSVHIERSGSNLNPLRKRNMVPSTNDPLPMPRKGAVEPGDEPKWSGSGTDVGVW